MKIYKLNLNFFSGVEWKDISITIQAENLNQLKSAALNELQWADDDSIPQRKNEDEKKYRQRLSVALWKKHEKNIQHTELNFPIIIRN